MFCNFYDDSNIQFQFKFFEEHYYSIFKREAFIKREINGIHSLLVFEKEFYYLSFKKKFSKINLELIITKTFILLSHLLT